MTEPVLLTDTYQAITTGTSATLIVPSRPNVTDKIEYFIGDSTPADTAPGFPWNYPFNIPAGVKVWAKGNATLFVSRYTQL